MLKALGPGKCPDALPGSRSCVPKSCLVAQPLHLGSQCRNIRCCKGFRHSSQIEIGIRQSRHHPGQSRNGAGTIRQHGRAVIRIRLRNQPPHAVCNMQISILVQKRPVGIALGHQQKNLLWLCYSCTTGTAPEVIIKIITVRCHPRPGCRQIFNLLRCKI